LRASCEKGKTALGLPGWIGIRDDPFDVEHPDVLDGLHEECRLEKEAELSLVCDYEEEEKEGRRATMGRENSPLVAQDRTDQRERRREGSDPC
jgi:hypothetical protein